MTEPTPDLNLAELRNASREVLAQQVALLQQERLRLVGDARRETPVSELAKAVAAKLEDKTTYAACDTDVVDGSLEEVVEAVLAVLVERAERPR